uniref:Uncharacterized protein n=1 Tax=Rhizophora mucronata TaxID=61149 RepID=A0A2P2LJZ4_RHIMU
MLKPPSLKARRAIFSSVSKNRSPELKQVFLGTQRERAIRLGLESFYSFWLGLL